MPLQTYFLFADSVHSFNSFVVVVVVPSGSTHRRSQSRQLSVSSQPKQQYAPENMCQALGLPRAAPGYRCQALRSAPRYRCQALRVSCRRLRFPRTKKPKAKATSWATRTKKLLRRRAARTGWRRSSQPMTKSCRVRRICLRSSLESRPGSGAGRMSF